MNAESINDIIQGHISKVIQEEEEKLLKTLTLKWYKANNHPAPEDFRVIENSVRVISSYYGFVEGYEPKYEDVELFDLRHVYTCTVAELFDKYF